MYNYISDKEFLSRMRKTCVNIMQELCHKLKEKYDMGASFDHIVSCRKKSNNAKCQ